MEFLVFLAEGWERFLDLLRTSLFADVPSQPSAPRLTFVRLVTGPSNMPSIVYAVGLAPSTDPNTASYISSLVIGTAPAVVGPVKDGDQVTIPVGDNYTYMVQGVNTAGLKGPFSLPLTGVATVPPNLPAQPGVPTFTYVAQLP